MCVKRRTSSKLTSDLATPSFFFSSRRRHTRWPRDWSSDVCSSDLEWVEAGAIGTVREVHFWTNRPIWPQAIDRPLEEYYAPATLDWNLWLGPAPERPYHPAYAPFKWRGFWDFGTGALGDMACHIMDAAYWTLDLGYPTRIEAESTPLFKETAPAGSRISYTFAAQGKRPEVKVRSEEHTSELQSRGHLVCRLLLEKKNTKYYSSD